MYFLTGKWDETGCDGSDSGAPDERERNERDGKGR